MAPELLAPPANVMRVALHPDGMAPRIVNFAEWRAHLLERLRHQVSVTGDAALAALYEEVSGYPGPPDAGAHHGAGGEVFVPLVFRAADRELRFFSTVATFGTAVDITVSELAIESFFPADCRDGRGAARRLARACSRGASPGPCRMPRDARRRRATHAPQRPRRSTAAVLRCVRCAARAVASSTTHPSRQRHRRRAGRS